MSISSSSAEPKCSPATRPITHRLRHAAFPRHDSRDSTSSPARRRESMTCTSPSSLDRAMNVCFRPAPARQVHLGSHGDQGLPGCHRVAFRDAIRYDRLEQAQHRNAPMPICVRWSSTACAPSTIRLLRGERKRELLFFSAGARRTNAARSSSPAIAALRLGEISRRRWSPPRSSTGCSPRPHVTPQARATAPRRGTAGARGRDPSRRPTADYLITAPNHASLRTIRF